MEKTTTRPDEALRTYLAALASYLEQGSEAALQTAYQFGRRSLTEGQSILDMVLLHNQAIRATAKTGSICLRDLNRAGEFFVECISPFEMTHRAFGEANRALRGLNETLEEQMRLIGRELHDESGQLLAAVHIELDEMARDLPAAQQGCLQRAKEHLDQVETQLRNVSHELRPTVLDDLGLAAALDSLSRRTAKRTGLRISPQLGNGPRLPVRVELAVYRIVQEALNNVTRHAQATAVRIRLRRSSKQVVCTVEDNGIGFQPGAARPEQDARGIGLLGVQERVQALRGSLRVDSTPGKGTKLEVAIPLEG